MTKNHLTPHAKKTAIIAPFIFAAFAGTVIATCIDTTPKPQDKFNNEKAGDRYRDTVAQLAKQFQNAGFRADSEPKSGVVILDNKPVDISYKTNGNPCGNSGNKEPKRIVVIVDLLKPNPEQMKNYAICQDSAPNPPVSKPEKPLTNFAAACSLR